jgi:hypothetical protein
MKAYESLLKLHKDQNPTSVFAHFYPMSQGAAPADWDAPMKAIANQSIDGYDAWTFVQERFRLKHSESVVPKLRNYLNYTFVRLVHLEQDEPGNYFIFSRSNTWACFNTGLQNAFGADLLAIFEVYRPKHDGNSFPRPDWVYKGCYTASERQYREIFGLTIPKIAWYSRDSRDYVFDTSYSLDKDAFDHLFELAKERAGLGANASDEVVRNYLRGAIENLVPKIARNYKVAIPVYYVEEKRMQTLLPFVSADSTSVSAFLIERDDINRCYKLKTVFDLDQAYFSARLITRPDKEWLNP